MPLHILVVDDNQEATELLQELLSMEGHVVRTATTGSEACALLREQPAEVLMLDHHLPDTTGAQLLPQLQALQASQGVPPAIAVAVTGAVVHAPGGGAGFDHVLVKPIDFDALDALIARWSNR
ncbi:response regulator [Paracidovorax sp. MALMAid1276]|uniref:response regulator n=1 Tax=Paracidovorax sp. MALMAid1276 TaxID=3411631 RepID=UPI003B98F071